MKTLAVLIAVGLSTSTAAFAETADQWVGGGGGGRETHSIWQMTCRPWDGAPFIVKTNDSVGGQVIIFGQGGQSRSNDITNEKDFAHNFAIIAQGTDAHGRPRTIALVVSKHNDSALVVNGDTDNSIPCGNAHGAD